ncbi:MAG: BON domain-containing protein [Kiloniellales bacterium]
MLRLSAAVLFALLVFAAPGAQAFLDTILTAPKTLFERAIEARSSGDIVKDNKIVLAVNKIMADLGTIKASTEIYEQRLLVTGLFDDEALYEEFKTKTEAVSGVKKLYWHVRYMSEADQEKNEDEMLDWGDALLLDTKVGLNLVGTKGVADVNLRVAADAFSGIYILGRSRSEEEHKKAVQVARDTEGVSRVYDYIEVRP